MYDIINTLNFTNIVWQIVTPLIFSLADIITGFIQAVINKNVDTQIMRKGLLHKVLIILVIVLSFVIDLAFNLQFVSKVVCIYVIIMELLSIAENLKKAGIDLKELGDILENKKEGGNNNEIE